MRATQFIERRTKDSLPPRPVSYTHLDVYKRQELSLETGEIFCFERAPVRAEALTLKTEDEKSYMHSWLLAKDGWDFLSWKDRVTNADVLERVAEKRRVIRGRKRIWLGNTR